MLRTSSDVIPSMTVAELPPASAAPYQFFIVTDAVTPASSDIPVMGGGNSRVPVWSNGEYWATLFSPSAPDSLLRSNLGYMQLYNPAIGEFYTFSQNGNFAAAARDGDAISAFGPSVLFPAVRMPRARTIASLPDGDYIGMGSGQSNLVAALPLDATGDGGASRILTVNAPLPGRLIMFQGGTFPNQYGAGAASAGHAIDPGQYQSIRSLKQGTNDGRVNGPFYRETLGTTAALEIALALSPNSRLLWYEWGSGSTAFQEVVGQNLNISAASWSDGVGTFDTIGMVNLAPGERAVITGFGPAGWNGSFTILSWANLGGNTSRITVTMDDPGGVSPSILGKVSSPATQFKNALAALGYFADNLARPGMPVRLLYHIHVGHESNTQDAYAQAPIQYSYLKDRVAELGARVNPSAPAPKLVMPICHYGRADHHDSRTRSGHTSESQALWRSDKARAGDDPDFQTCSMYFLKVADGALVGTPHSDPDTQPLIGSKLGHLVVDLYNGETIAAPVPNDDFEMVLDDPMRIKGTLPYEFEHDATEVSDPARTDGHMGRKGIQVFQAAGIASDAAYAERQLVDVELDGTTMTVRAQEPIGTRRILVTGAYATNDVINDINNWPITAFSWDGVEVTIEFEGPHALDPGDPFALVDIVTANGNVGVRQVCADVVDANTLTFAMADDPGAWTPGTGRMAINGLPCNGRGRGNRTTLRMAGDARHKCVTDGSDRHDYMLPFRFHVSIRSSEFGQEDMLDQIENIESGIKALYPTRYDFADSACCPDDATTAVVNQGSRGSTENMTKSNLSLSGSAGGKSRNTNLVSVGNLGQLTGSGSPVTWKDAHKAGQGWWGAFNFTHRQGVQNQYLGATSGGEGVGSGIGVFPRISATNIFNLVVRAGDSLSPFAVTPAIGTLVPGNRYTIAFYVKDGETGWCWCNGTVVRFPVAYSSPSASAAQGGFRIGTSGSPSNRRLVTGFALNCAAYGDGTTVFDYTDVEAYLRSLYHRTLNDP